MSWTTRNGYVVWDFDPDPDYEQTYGADPEQEDAANGHGQNEITIQQVLGTKERVMNQVKVTSFPSRGFSANDLKIGEYARVVGLPGTLYLGDILLKTRTHVINITDPNTTWVNAPFSMPFVERLHTGDKLEITVGLTTEFEDRIRSEARSNKIMAIKAVREATNWGLKEAKDYVESLLLKF